jgi:hypothetical protein
MKTSELKPGQRFRHADGTTLTKLAGNQAFDTKFNPREVNPDSVVEPIAPSSELPFKISGPHHELTGTVDTGGNGLYITVNGYGTHGKLDPLVTLGVGQRGQPVLIAHAEIDHAGSTHTIDFSRAKE